MPEEVSVVLELREGFAFDVTFEAATPGVIVADERPPLGRSTGPDSVGLLAASAGHAFSSALLFALHREHIEVRAFRAFVRAYLTRNGGGDVHVSGIRVRLEPSFTTEPPAGLPGRVLAFADECAVIRSLRAAIDIDADVVWPVHTMASVLVSDPRPRSSAG